jgi:hypothetical protein
MRVLWSEKLIENNKRFRQLKAANLLYKGSLFLATSHCATIVRGVFITLGRFVLRLCAGPGKQANRSAAQTEHDSGELGAEQKICRRSDAHK